jgi:hypothetical protein
MCPGDGYIWTPGYWAWDGEYYWVPGTWVMAPEAGYLWTPGYWGWAGDAFMFNEGYWGLSVGFYGGIACGFDTSVIVMKAAARKTGGFSTTRR